MRVLRNPAWWIPLVLFLLHQLLERGFGLAVPLLDNHLDALVAVPVLLGLLSVERGYLFGRPRLDAATVVTAVFIFAVVFEILFPRWQPRFTADWVDAMLYVVGGVYFWWLVNPERRGE